MIDISKLTTEQRNPSSMNLGSLSSYEVCALMNEEDSKISLCIKDHLKEISQAVDYCRTAFSGGGRLIYIGAGTSGRLGLLDAVECPPTFGVEPSMVVGLIAGGHKAFIKAVEGAEDSHTLCKEDLEALDLSPKDFVVGLAASGRTPYVVYGLRYARSIGCKTCAISCNKNSEIGKEADLPIEVEVGPEVLTGSTRLKSGTCQKMILNMISTGAMVGIGKVYENLMVDLMQTNEKLETRAVRILMESTECSEGAALEALKESHGSVKKAIVMILLDVGFNEACSYLESSSGNVKKVLDTYKRST